LHVRCRRSAREPQVIRDARALRCCRKMTSHQCARSKKHAGACVRGSHIALRYMPLAALLYCCKNLRQEKGRNRGRVFDFSLCLTLRTRCCPEQRLMLAEQAKKSLETMRLGSRGEGRATIPA